MGGVMDQAKRGPVAIVGAGIVGVSTAIWLQRAGYEVILIDRIGPAGGTSYGNAGVLAECSIVPLTVPGLIAKAPRMLLDPRQPLYLKWGYLPKLLPFLFRYLRHCTPEAVERIARALLPIIGESVADHRALAAGTGAEKWIKDARYSYVYRDRAHFESDAFAWNIRRAHGITWDELDGPALRAAEPTLNPENGFAASAHGQGRISDPGEYVKALAAHAVANGARLVIAEVEDVARENGRVTGVRAGGETIPCAAVVIATGAWSAALTKKLGLDIPLESERGYHIELVEPSITPNASLMIASGKFVATPMEGRLRLAGIVEFGGLEAPPSRAPFELLHSHARTLLPGLTWKDTREWMGHRPAPSDSIPIIGEVAGVSGAYLGFGHHHVGLTGGPKTGAILAGLISGQRPNLDLAPYSPMRFQ
jgi:D-amino-acid dehydrogenase